MSKRKSAGETPDVEARYLRVYRLKISLSNVSPPLWRRIEVYAGMELDSLATAIDDLFGWSGEHMGEFDIKGRRIGDDTGWSLDDSDDEEDEFQQILKPFKNPKYPGGKAQMGLDLFAALNATLKNPPAKAPSAEERETPALCDLVSRARTKFTYIYDFGDDWEHIIEVEKIHEAEAGVLYPRCTGGARANPLEDCGGSWGYQEMVDAVGNPEHERYSDLVEFGLEKWDPEHFSVEEADRSLAKLFRRKRNRGAK